MTKAIPVAFLQVRAWWRFDSAGASALHVARGGVSLMDAAAYLQGIPQVDPAARLRTGLADLYRFFLAAAGMLTCIYRDYAALPEEHQQALRDQDALFGDMLTAPFGGASHEHRRLRAVIGHAISFWTWRSLCLDHGLTDTEAVDAMTGMILATTTVPQAEPVH